MGYSREIFAEAAKKMEHRRLLSESELEERRRALYEISPRAEEIERQLIGISVAAAKTVVNGGDLRETLEKLRDQSLGLQTELKGILMSLGFEQNYLTQQFECSKCGDTGYIDGKMCDCMKLLLRQTAYEYVNLDSKLTLTDFDDFNLLYYPDEVIPPNNKNTRDYMRTVLHFCQRYAADFSTSSPSLLFQGAPGLGKTHLSLAIAKEVINGGYGVIYVSAPTMLKRLEDEQFGRNKNSDGINEELMTECDLLILDDLGTEFTTKFSIAAIYSLLNSRMLSDKPTIISTNLSMKALQEIYGNRLISRMIGQLDRIEFIGRDIRQIRRRERNKNSLKENNGNG